MLMYRLRYLASKRSPIQYRSFSGRYWSRGWIDLEAMEFAGKPVDDTLYLLPEVVKVTAQVIQPNDLVLEITFFEGSGTLAHDSSRYGNHTTLYGALWGSYNGVYLTSYDGVDDYGEVTETIDLNPHTSDWTIEVVVRPTKLSKPFFGNTYKSGFAPISKRHQTNVGNYELLLAMYDNEASETGPAQWIFFYHGDNQAAGAASDKIFYIGKWYYAAGVREGGNLYVYVNGKMWGPNNERIGGVFPSPDTDITSTDPWRIMTKQDWVVWYRGDVVLIRMWRRALTKTELDQVYEALKQVLPLEDA